MGRVVLVWWLLAVLPACASGPETRPSSVPAWVQRVPDESGVLHAVGMSEPTFHPTDALVRASDNARVQLALTLRAHVRSATFVHLRSDGRTHVETAATVEDFAHEQADAIIEHAEIVATWLDTDGAFSGRRGTGYALARVPVARASAALQGDSR